MSDFKISTMLNQNTISVVVYRFHTVSENNNDFIGLRCRSPIIQEDVINIVIVSPISATSGGSMLTMNGKLDDLSINLFQFQKVTLVRHCFSNSHIIIPSTVIKGTEEINLLALSEGKKMGAAARWTVSL